MQPDREGGERIVFGRWLSNIQASSENPQRRGMYVRTVRRRGRMNPGTFYELTDGRGRFWLTPPHALQADDPPVPSPTKLRLIADWLDAIDDERGTESVRGPGYLPNDGESPRQVQVDLRAWADAALAASASQPVQPTDEVRMLLVQAREVLRRQTVRGTNSPRPEPIARGLADEIDAFLIAASPVVRSSGETND